MPNLTDLSPCISNWSFQDQSTFAKLDFYLAKKQTKDLPWHRTFSDLFKTWKWEPKQGNKVRAVQKEHSPINRSMFYPAQRTAPAKRDQVAIQESSEDAVLYHHKVESELLYYDADFSTFLDNHKFVGQDITRKIGVYPELFYRSAAWDMAPFVYVCGYGWININHTTNGVFDGTAKSQPQLLDMVAKCTKRLTMQELDRIGQSAVDELNFVPVQGGTSPATSGNVKDILTDKFILITDRAVANNLKYDDYVQVNRDLQRDLLTKRFTGQIFDQFAMRAERFPLRMLNAADVITFPAPEVVELGAVARYGKAVTNPTYASSQVTVSWLVGDAPYEAIQPGPPPAAFAGTMDKDKFQGLNWNGKVQETRNVLIPCPANIDVDQSGSTQNQLLFDTNKYGDVSQYISLLTMGIKPCNRYNMLPIVHLRPLPAIPV